VGESIEDMTGDKPKTGRSDLTKSEVADRDERLAADRVKGHSWEWIMAKYDLSRRTVQERYEVWRGKNAHAFEDVNAIEIVHGMLDTYQAIAEQAADIGVTAKGENGQLGALNTQMSAMRQVAELCQATGILPKQLGTLKMEVDARVLSQKLIRVLNEYEVDAKVKRALLQELGDENAGGMPVAGLPDGGD
jgi:hypothetical protein